MALDHSTYASSAVCGGAPKRHSSYGFYYYDLPFDSRLKEFSPAKTRRGVALSFVSNRNTGPVIAVGTTMFKLEGQSLSPFGAIRKTDSVVGYTCNSLPGDCGSIVYCVDGPVGIHVGTGSSSQNRHVNFFASFLLLDSHPEASPRIHKPMPKPRVLSRKEGIMRVKAEKLFGPGGKNRKSNESWVLYGESKHFHFGSQPLPLPGPKAAGAGTPKPKKAIVKPKKESLVSMGPAPSDYIGPRGSTDSSLVSSFVETMTNPWSGTPARLPDCVVVPTGVAKFFANRTYTLTNTAVFGPNFLFGLNTRMSLSSKLSPAAEATTSSAAPVVTGGIYDTTPGNILLPIQWGQTTYVDPHVSYANGSGTGWPAGLSAWGDDFGATLGSTAPYVSAYRTLASAIRVRIVGLPPSQFMTPGKIYFAQVRYDFEDLPVTEQDFVGLEQLGRATHVSADAVRASGSKTVFMTPDGSEKFLMSSNFILAPGLVPIGTSADPTATARKFPSVASSVTLGIDPMKAIVPYISSANTGLPTATGGGAVDNPDSFNADSTSILLVAYFGASDGVVLELDYANVVEYIANKSAPAGVESVVQLPSSAAMDQIYAASAVASQMRPILLQAPGDKTISSPGASSSSSESAKVRGEITRLARSKMGNTVEAGWLWDLFAKGSLGGGKIKWDL